MQASYLAEYTTYPQREEEAYDGKEEGDVLSQMMHPPPPPVEHVSIGWAVDVDAVTLCAKSKKPLTGQLFAGHPRIRLCFGRRSFGQ